jgi:hypothetical protein
LLFVFLLSACSQTTVYIYDKHLNEQDALSITRNLQDLGLKVKRISLPFPDSIRQSALVYSLMMANSLEIALVESRLISLGWPVDQQNPFFRDNHSFKKNSFGLFLVPQGLDIDRANEISSVAATYASHNCTPNLQLEVKLDGTYKLKHEEGDLLDKGNWVIRQYPYITFSNPRVDIWDATFTVETGLEIEKIGSVEKIYLRPVDHHPTFLNCKFGHGQIKTLGQKSL